MNLQPVNPYQTPTLTERTRARRTRTPPLTSWHFVAFGMTLVNGIAMPWFISNELTSIPIFLRNALGFAILIGLPAIYWESFCRLSPRPKSIVRSISNSFGRCVMLYHVCFWGGLAGSGYASQHIPYSNRQRLEYLGWVGFVILPILVFIGNGALFLYDYWQAWLASIGPRTTPSHSQHS